MAGSFGSRIFAAAAMAAMALATATTNVAAYPVRCWRVVTNGWRIAYAWYVDRFDWLVSRIKIDEPRFDPAPRRALLGAVQMMGRMIRRDRPLVSPRWRLCPSV